MMATQESVRLISYSDELEDGVPVYFSSNGLPVKALNFEPAGHSFHNVALRLRGFFEEEDSDTDDQKVPSVKEPAYTPSAESYSTKGKKKSGAGGKQQDHYALLGLGHLRYLATEEQIRKSYRETALKHHPDKQAALLLLEETEDAKQTKKDEIENHFKAIQEAYEVLIDPTRRRIYDSTDEFDDAIPTECAPQDFFIVFGPAFKRNGQWSVNQPVPSLGDDNTTMKEVDSFYNFWYGFKSWREFPQEDEFDLEQAESRDHKRWMERQNAKLTEKARKEETARIRSLVDAAYKRDPRIQKRKEEEKAEKQKKKQAKYLAKKLQEEEAARVAEEQRRQKEEEDKRAAEAALSQKKNREKEKKLLRKERTRLRTVAAPILSQHLLNLTADDVETICMSLATEQLRGLCDKIVASNGEVAQQAKLIKDALGSNHDSVEDQKLEQKKVKENGSVPQVASSSILLSSVEKKEKPWGKEEIELLRKGTQKYPKGTSRRWEVISEYIGTGRSVEEILKATKTVLLQKPDSGKAFDSFLEKRKPAPSIASPLTTRDEVQGSSVPTTVNGPTTGNEVTKIDSVKDSTTVHGTNDQKKEPSDASSASAAAAQSDGDSNNNTAAGTEGSSSSEQDAWSAVQERALVQALKTFAKDAPQRWERVAAAVPGKTVNQCKKKLTSLKESFRNKKNAV